MWLGTVVQRYRVGWDETGKWNVWSMGLFQVRKGLKASGWELKHRNSNGNFAFALSHLESGHTCTHTPSRLFYCVPRCL